MSARTLDIRGTVVPDRWDWGQIRDRLAVLATDYPVGTRVTHRGGREGTIALDQPNHVPGVFNGEPTAVCLTGDWHDEPMVFAHWDNEAELVWGVWVPASSLRGARALVTNRPGIKAKARKGGRR
ncbi:hypothetical protein ACFWR9_11215 [Streptomyces sp. NPDC058534]|uniref:hypothetical protein n=1 Tax=Streptomyces sp. NPDC058534 TaxID=3346541 RepID=UPI003646EDB6